MRLGHASCNDLPCFASWYLYDFWRPVRGRHGLELVDGHGRVVDRVSFDVRGVPRAARVEPAR